MKETLSTPAIVLSISASGERFFRLRLLSPGHGLLTALLRQASSQAKNRPPREAVGLFDELEVVLESSNAASGPWFFREHRKTKSHTGIGHSYEALELASDFARLLLANAEHFETFDEVYALTSRAFRAFSSGAPPIATLVKALFRLARMEGLPVKEDWLVHLPPAVLDDALTILKTPGDTLQMEPERLEQVLDALEFWFREHTDFRFSQNG